MYWLNLLCSSSKRKHRWAAKHLKEYREKPNWLWIRRIRRTCLHPLVFPYMVNRRFFYKIGNSINIPKLGTLKAKDVGE